MMALQMIGYTDVSILGGGMQAWDATHAPPFDLQGALGDLLANLPDDAGAVEAASLSGAQPFLLDVRYPEEYATGFIEGALNIPLRELTQHLDALPSLEAPMVLIDDSGFRSAIAMTTLRLLGYQNAQSLVGGIEAWTAAGLPLVTQPVPALPAGTAPQVNPDLLAVIDAYLPEVQPEAWSTFTPQALAELPAGTAPLLVDVRQPEAYAQGHIEDSLNIPLSELVQHLDQIPVDQPVVLVDASGHRAVLGMTVLQLLGYEDVKVLAGGIAAWDAADLPLVAALLDRELMASAVFQFLPRFSIP
jgi:rhodanese-related sulfurtransferase